MRNGSQEVCTVYFVKGAIVIEIYYKLGLVHRSISANLENLSIFHQNIICNTKVCPFSTKKPMIV